MSITSWITKKQTKEIIKGIIQAVREMVEQLLTSKVKIQRKDTANHSTATKAELIKKQAHSILKGSK